MGDSQIHAVNLADCAIFGGYDKARIWHFWLMWLFILFVVLHVVLVLAETHFAA
jgi:thiosulfate reductase cytochrome b subunit